jgi:hypothetical protein
MYSSTFRLCFPFVTDSLEYATSDYTFRFVIDSLCLWYATSYYAFSFVTDNLRYAASDYAFPLVTDSQHPDCSSCFTHT